MADDSRSHKSRGPAVLIVCVTTLALCTVFTALRLISRAVVVRKVGPDDYIVIIAWILAVATSFTLCYGTGFGLGSHDWDIPDDDIIPMKKTAYVCSILYNPALVATKSSILVFYLTISRGQKIFQWATYGALAVLNVGGFALTLLNTFQCRPISAAWEDVTPSAVTCTNIVTIFLSSAPLNIATDLSVLFLPMPLLTRMRLPMKQKVILIITFGFGVFLAIVDVIRIAFVQSAAVEHFETMAAHGQGESGPGGTPDFSWYAAFAYMWSCVEINVSIMCGCVPALKPLVSRYLPQLIQNAATLREKTITFTSGSVSARPPTADGQQQFNHRTSESAKESRLEAPPPARLPHSEGDAERAMGLTEFLAAPDMEVTAPSLAPPRARRGSVFFDFVDTGRKKNITLMTNRESIRPVLIVTVLFFVWGFAYGLLTSLNGRFQEVVGINITRTYGEHSAYFVGYFIAPLTFARPISHHWGFKPCYSIGLGLYACGTLVFWPSAVLHSFAAFLVSNFVVGMGLATLEVAANPFIALCGPPEYAEVRLNLSQGIQAIGSILSPLLAKRGLFKLTAPDNLIDAQWTYLGICFFTVLLAVLYFYIRLEDATDEELENASARMAIPREATVGSTHVKVVWLTLAMAVFAQFCYVGGQESIATGFRGYLHFMLPSLQGDNYRALGYTAFAVSRFFAAFLNIWIKPRYLLFFYFVGAVAFSAACTRTTEDAAGALLIMTMFFEGPLFPLIFAQSLRGMGKRARDAAVLLTAAAGGGALLPPIMYLVREAHGIPYSFRVPVTVFAAGAVYPLYLIFYTPAGRIVDPVRDPRLRRGQIAGRERRKRKGSGIKARMKGLFRVKKSSTDAHRGSANSDRAMTPKCRSRTDISPTRDEEIQSQPNSGTESLGFDTVPAWVSGARLNLPEKNAASTDRFEESDRLESDIGEGPSTSRGRIPHEGARGFVTSPGWLSSVTARDEDYDEYAGTPDFVTTPDWLSRSNTKDEEESCDPTLGIGG